MRRNIRERASLFLFVVCVFALGIGAPALGVDKLIVKDSGSNNVFVVQDTGFTGIGTATPLRKLHIKTTSTVAADQELLNLEGATAAKFRMVNNTSGESWVFALDSLGLKFSRQGSGGADFRVENGGRVQMGPGAVTNFDLSPVGDLTIAGALTQNSSRTAKQGFEPVQPEMVLAKVMDLPISTWSYRDNPESVRHMGPMAEDFRAAFGLGATDTGISAVDTDGVAFAAIQGLYRKLEEKDGKIAALEQEKQQIQARVDALEQKMNLLLEKVSAEQ